MAVAPSVRIRVQTTPKVRIRVTPALIPLNATVAVGGVTTLPAGSPATVTNVGTPSAVVLDFGLPQGNQGNPGVVQSVVAGANVAVNSVDPAHPVVSATGDITAAQVAAGYQPLDADLTAWAGVNPSSYSTTAQIAAAYQPLDSDLTAIAALSTTSYGRGLLTLANQAAFSNETILTQPYTGGVSRFAIAKLKDGPVSLEDFGFVSGNALAALNLALASGAPIKLKAGKYVVNGLPNTVTNTPVSLEGHGGGMSILEFTGATSGLTISQDDFTHPTFVRNLLLQTTQQEAGDALTVTYSKTDSITNRAVARCVLEDVWCWGDNVLASGWRKGIKCTDIFALSIVRPVVVGRKNNSLTGVAIFKLMTAGIEIIGSDTPTLSAVPGNINIDNPNVSHSNTGIKASGEVEGLFITKPVVVAADFGVDVNYTTKRPLLDVRGGHVEVFTTGVRAVNAPQSFVTGVCVYKSPLTHTDTYGVHLTGCDDSSVVDNTLMNQSTANDALVDGEWIGVVVNNSDRCTIKTIRHNRPSKTVILGGTTTGTQTSGLQPNGTYPNASVATYEDGSSGTNVYSGGNKPVGSVQNAGAVTILSSFTAAGSVALTVYKGERYLVQGNMQATKGATAGELLTQLTKTAGTATVVFGAGATSLLERTAQAISATVAHSVSCIVTVTVSGTLTISLGGTSTGSNSTVAIGDSQLSITLL